MGRQFSVFAVLLAAAGAYHALNGAVHHPVESLLNLKVIGWLVVFAAMGEGVAAENMECNKAYRKAMFFEAAVTAAAGVLLAWFLQVVYTGAYSPSLPLFAFGGIIVFFSLANAVNDERKLFPTISLFAVVWGIIYGAWMEFL